MEDLLISIVVVVGTGVIGLVAFSLITRLLVYVGGEPLMDLSFFFEMVFCVLVPGAWSLHVLATDDSLSGPLLLVYMAGAFGAMRYWSDQEELNDFLD